jgi:ABC-2 type transport system ATP-binding protein
MRQRLALASALLHAPQILFLDEPTAGVDPHARRSFWQLIRSLAAEGTTIFVTTHYMDEAEFCHRIGLMVDGRLVALDSPAALKKKHVPGTLYELKGLNIEKALHHSLKLPGVLAAQPFGATAHIRLDSTILDGQGLQAALQAAGLSALELRAINPTLEDVFLAVIEAESEAGCPPS